MIYIKFYELREVLFKTEASMFETKNYFVKIYQIVMCMESDLHKYIHDVHCVLLQFCGSNFREVPVFFTFYISEYN